jgi:hypothetical protein
MGMTRMARTAELVATEDERRDEYVRSFHLEIKTNPIIK